jgi:hypothetical protein
MRTAKTYIFKAESFGSGSVCLGHRRNCRFTFKLTTTEALLDSQPSYGGSLIIIIGNK